MISQPVSNHSSPQDLNNISNNSHLTENYPPYSSAVTSATSSRDVDNYPISAVSLNPYPSIYNNDHTTNTSSSYTANSHTAFGGYATPPAHSATGNTNSIGSGGISAIKAKNSKHVTAVDKTNEMDLFAVSS
jgi:hypothetical protein